MRRLLLLMLLTVASGLPGLVTGPANALPCQQSPKSLQSELRTASLVFTGDVRGIDEQGGEATYDVRVARVYRGEVAERATVHAPAKPGNCGLSGIGKGQRWLFLSSSGGDRIQTRSHEGSVEATGKVVRKVEAELGDGEKPATETEEPVTAELTNVSDGGPEDFWPISIPGFALVAIGLVVLAGARGMSRRADRHS